MRRIAVACGAVALTLFLAVSALWWIEAHKVKTIIANWTDRPLANRFAFSHADVVIGGFPFHLEISISEPAIAMLGTQDRWVAPVLRAHADIWRTDQFDYETVGHFEHGSEATAVIINVPTLHGTIEIAEGMVRSLSFTAQSIHIDGVGSGEVAVGAANGLVSLTPERAADLKSDAAELRVSLHAIDLVSSAFGSALKEPISKIELLLGLTGPPPWDGAPDTLIRWRDAGGTLELRQLALAWAGLSLEGDGTFAVDDQLRPEGAVSLRLDGLQETLRRLSEEGTLSPAFAELIGQSIAELAVPDERFPGRLLISLAAQDGRLTSQEHLLGILAPITGP